MERKVLSMYDNTWKLTRLERLLASLNDRTNLSIGFHDYTLSYSGRNGRHEKFNFSEGHSTKGVIILDELVLSRKPISDDKRVNYIELRVAKSWFDRFFTRSFKIPAWWENLVYVYMPISHKVKWNLDQDMYIHFGMFAWKNDEKNIVGIMYPQFYSQSFALINQLHKADMNSKEIYCGKGESLKDNVLTFNNMLSGEIVYSIEQRDDEAVVFYTLKISNDTYKGWDEVTILEWNHYIFHKDTAGLADSASTE